VSFHPPAAFTSGVGKCFRAVAHFVLNECQRPPFRCSVQVSGFWRTCGWPGSARVALIC
jgi:hypothetical protein